MNTSRGVFATVLISAAAVFGSACAHTGGATKPQTPAAPVATAPSETPKTGDKPPLVKENPDGTITIQTPPEKKEGLIIKPQVIKPVPPKDETPSESAPGTQP